MCIPYLLYVPHLGHWISQGLTQLSLCTYFLFWNDPPSCFPIPPSLAPHLSVKHLASCQLDLISSVISSLALCKALFSSWHGVSGTMIGLGTRGLYRNRADKNEYILRRLDRLIPYAVGTPMAVTHWRGWDTIAFQSMRFVPQHLNLVPKTWRILRATGLQTTMEVGRSWGLWRNTAEGEAATQPSSWTG